MPSVICSICGSTEPSHGHVPDGRIEDYFIVGRGETDFEAAQRWHMRAVKAEKRLQEMEQLWQNGYEAGLRHGQLLGQVPGQKPGQTQQPQKS